MPVSRGGGAEVGIQVQVEGRPVDTDRADAVLFQPHPAPVTARW